MTSQREELDELTAVPRPRRLALKVRTAAALIDVAPSKMYQLVSRKVVRSIRVDNAIQRGGPRISDRLLRLDPDRREGVWNVQKETELPG